jgi:hypothetical protein
MAKKTPHPLEGARSWNMMAPSYQNTKAAANWNSDNGWEFNGANSLYYETYIDLSGFEMEDLTILPMETAIQDPGLYSGGRLTTPLWVMDVVSQTRLGAETLTNMLDITNNDYNNSPGMMGQPQDFNQITMGQLRIMGNTTQVATTGQLLPPWISQSLSTFGSGAPVTVQKLWVYRFVLLEAAENSPLNIPASRILLRGMVTKESDLVYIQRLRRAYELQGALN